MAAAVAALDGGRVRNFQCRRRVRVADAGELVGVTAHRESGYRARRRRRTGDEVRTLRGGRGVEGGGLVSRAAEPQKATSRTENTPMSPNRLIFLPLSFSCS